jgi:chromosomal replication initiator protein
MNTIEIKIAHYETEISRLEKLEALEKRFKELSAQYADTTDDVEAIICACCQVFEVSRKDIMGRTRTEAIANARQTAMSFVRARKAYSFARIGCMFSGRDHGTVLHACRAIEDKCYNKAFLQKYTAVENLVNKMVGTSPT